MTLNERRIRNDEPARDTELVEEAIDWLIDMFPESVRPELLRQRDAIRDGVVASIKTARGSN